jgi:hypothetical protein
MCDVDRLVKLAFSGLSPLVVEEVADDGELVRVQALRRRRRPAARAAASRRLGCTATIGGR